LLPARGRLAFASGQFRKNLRPQTEQISSPARQRSAGILAVFQAPTTPQKEKSAHVRRMVSWLYRVGAYAGKGYRQLFIKNDTVVFRVDENKKQVLIVTVRYSKSSF